MKVCSVCHGRHEEFEACVDAQAIPGFQLVELISSAPSAELHRATEVASGRSCLIKIITTDNQGSEKILREAKVAAGLFHPAIASIYDAGRLDDGRCFIVSEHIEGRTLREILDAVGIPDLLDTIEIIRQAAEGLQALHDGALTHGAVNPRNIILSGDARRPVVRLQVADLGRAAQQTIISNRFPDDSELDALRYFSPEQCTGEDASVHSDVYSLGVVFYELLAGVPPFDATTAAGLIHQHKNQQPPEIKVQNFDLRMLVTHALTEALQKTPRLRQSSANMFARQLRHIEQLATHATTPPPAGVVRKPTLPAKPAPGRVVISPTSKTDDSVQTEAVSKLGTETSATHTRAIAVEIHDVARVAESAPGTSGDPMDSTTSNEKPIFITARARLNSWKKKVKALATGLASDTKPRAASIFASGASKRTDDLSTGALSRDENPVRVDRKKIEWQTPDDDIPSEAAVSEVLANEGIPHTSEPLNAERIEAAIVEVPERKAVEIPMVETVIETPVIFTAPIKTEIPPAVKARHIDARRRSAKSRVIADRKQKTANEPLAKETPKENSIPEPVPVIAAIENVPPPTAFHLTSNIKAPANVAGDTNCPPTKTNTAKPNRSGLGFKVNLADLEEITLVRPPNKRIKIDWDRAVARPDLFTAKPSRAAQREIVFSPTLLGDRAETVETLRNDEIFAGYGGSDTRGPGRHRSVMIGGGIVALLALLLFGNDSVTRYFQTWSSADSVSTESVSARDTQPPVAATAKTSKPRVTKKDRAIVKEQNAVLAAPVPKITTRVDSKPAPKSSIPEKTKPASQIKVEKRASEKSPRASAGSATRPRIVADPKH